MKVKHSIIALVLALALAFTLIGCGSGEKETVTEEEKKTTIEDEKETVTEDEELTITDIAGREIVLDGIPERVASAGATLRLYTYIAGTDKVCGIEKVQQQGQNTPRPYFMAYPEIADIQIIGEGKGQMPDAELILEANPDVVFINLTDIGAIDELQSKTGVPFIVIDNGDDESIANETLLKSLKLIGNIMGLDDRATEVVDFLKDCEADLVNRTKDIPDSEKPTMYVGGLAWSGLHGIESTTAKSPLLNSINANNVANEVDDTGTFDVDKEQILEWNPEYIFIDSAGYQLVCDDYTNKPDFYENLSAVKNGNVYMQLAYTNNDHNSETAIADAYYVGSVLYPDAFSDIEPTKKADEIFEFMLGTPVYEQMAALCGGYGKISLN